MCCCGKNITWLLCGGEHKFLLRSAWIVLVITTLIDVCAIIAYWLLAPKTFESKQVFRLSVFLIAAVLFLYFFVIMLCCFIFLKLSPKDPEPSGEPTILNSNRIINHPVFNFGSFSHPSRAYAERVQIILPNNTPPPLPSRSSPRLTASTGLPELPKRRPYMTENAARSNVEKGNSSVAKVASANDSLSTTQSFTNTSAVANVPEIVITTPKEDTVPVNGNTQTSQHSTSNENHSPTGKKFQNITSNSSSWFYCSDAIRYFAVEKQNKGTSMQETKVDSGMTNGHISVKPASSGFKSNDNSSNASHYYKKEMDTEKMSNDPKIDTSLTVKPVVSRSKSFGNRCEVKPLSADAKQTLEMSLHLTKVNSRAIDAFKISSQPESFVNGLNTNKSNEEGKHTLEKPMLQTKTGLKSTSNHATKRKVSACSEASKQVKSKLCTVSRKTDSFLAKSQPLINQYKKCTVDKLPSTSKIDTQMLFKAISQTEALFQQKTNLQAETDDPKVEKRLSDVVMV